MTAALERIPIDGAEYTIRDATVPGEPHPAFQVTGCHDRRSSYTVRLGADGYPASCTCPHHCHRKARCKHMQAVAGRIAEATRPADAREVPPACLVSGLWRAEFRVLPGGDHVELTSWNRGDLLRTELLEREPARRRWAELREIGWEKF